MEATELSVSGVGWTLGYLYTGGVLVVVAVEDRRLAEFELRSPAKPQHLGGFEGQRV